MLYANILYITQVIKYDLMRLNKIAFVYEYIYERFIFMYICVHKQDINLRLWLR